MIKEKMFVTVNGKEYLLDSLKCKYIGQEKDDEIWNADILANVNGYTYYKTFYDVENNVIEYRVE